MPNDLRYPIGEFSRPAALTAGERRLAIAQITGLPAMLRAAVAGLSDDP